MSLTRAFLKSMGLEEDKVTSIIEAHTETVEALKKERDSFKSDAEKLPKVEEELKQAKEAAKNSGDYDKLKKEFDDYKADVANKETLAAKKAVLSKIAKDAGLSEAGIAKALKYTDFGAVELDEKGEAKDSKALLKSLKEEWPEYIQTTRTEGVNTPNPPQTTGGSKMSRADIYAKDDHGRYKLSASERQKALAENPELMKG